MCIRDRFWERNCYSLELQEYQRIAVLVSLDAIHSGLLPQYLEQAKQDGRRYLLEHAKRIEGGLAMNEKLSRPQFNQMDTTEKQALMESLAARYTMTFLGLHTFDHWGQSCTTGIFKKDGREFVFVPGDTVTLGWEQFAEGLNQERREELDYLFQEWEMEPQNPEEMIRESMAPVRQAVIGPMLVGRELEELCWEPVKMDDPRPVSYTHLDVYKRQRHAHALQAAGDLRGLLQRLHDHAGREAQLQPDAERAHDVLHVELAHERVVEADRKSTRLNSSHSAKSRMPSSA